MDSQWSRFRCDQIWPRKNNQISGKRWLRLCRLLCRSLPPLSRFGMNIQCNTQPARPEAATCDFIFITHSNLVLCARQHTNCNFVMARCLSLLHTLSSQSALFHFPFDSARLNPLVAQVRLFDCTHSCYPDDVMKNACLATSSPYVYFAKLIVRFIFFFLFWFGKVASWPRSNAYLYA